MFQPTLIREVVVPPAPSAEIPDFGFGPLIGLVGVSFALVTRFRLEILARRLRVLLLVGLRVLVLPGAATSNFARIR